MNLGASGVSAARPLPRDSQFQHHDGDDDRHHAIAESFHPALVHGSNFPGEVAHSNRPRLEDPGVDTAQVQFLAEG